jgi:hypothetical protein
VVVLEVVMVLVRLGLVGANRKAQFPLLKHFLGISLYCVFTFCGLKAEQAGYGMVWSDGEGMRRKKEREKR